MKVGQGSTKLVNDAVAVRELIHIWDEGEEIMSDLKN
ncbi:hypothetical protein SM11_pC1119 (plasmid) [Sinorhizobium meliloti SM11]|uniref:Uncharacterized protein n=1 Tax=Sinorhizobium meliloti (strain SM11) TaxID=707241 RepID=F7XF67_SINMM|nr:hypothetical protein SM11_pC1119 [Sinorhizobium meliloti SM11]PII39258.1 hypothetical protein T190_08230 [Sinorhizobium meliloti CCBAU 01290]